MLEKQILMISISDDRFSQVPNLFSEWFKRLEPSTRQENQYCKRFSVSSENDILHGKWINIMAKKHKGNKKKITGAQESSPKALRKTRTPVSFLDVLSENFAPMRPWLSQDLVDMIRDGEKGPITSLRQTPTYFRSMIAALSRTALPETWPKASYHPGRHGQRNLAMSERIFLMRVPFSDRFYEAALSLNLAGNRVYNLSDSFVQRMLATKLDMPNERIRLPHRAVAITAANETMTRAFLGAARQHEYRENMKIVVYAALEEITGKRILHIMTMRLEGRKSEEMLMASIPFPDGERTADSIRNYLSTSKSENPYKSGEQEVHLQDWFADSAAGYYRTLLNCILYLTIPNAHVGPVYKPSNNGSDMNATRILADTQDVGRDMAPLFLRPGEMFEKERFEVKAPGTGRKLDHMVLVSGHYRDLPRQQHLPEKDRREIWIEPYLKGPDGTEMRNKLYVVL